MNTTTTRGRIIVGGIVTAIVFPAFTACGTEVAAPAQDISGTTSQKQDRPAPVPQRTTGNRVDFGDEYGTARAPRRSSEPAWRGSGNRVDFRDDGH